MTRALTQEEKYQHFVNRFFLKVKKTSGCWVWQGNIFLQGYGSVSKRIDGKIYTLKAHRVSWEIHHGPIQDNKCVLHKCDNRKCVRPDHLFIGTRKENNIDRSKKMRSAHGMKHPNAKFDFKMVNKLRADWDSGMFKQKDLMKKYSVSQGLISLIVNNKQRNFA